MEKKYWKWIGAFLLALVVLYFLLRRKTIQENTLPELITPQWLHFNFGPRDIAMAANGLPIVGDTASASSSPCGCSAGSSELLNGFADLANQFRSGAMAAFSQYEKAVTSQIPTLVSQYFNNPNMSQLQSDQHFFGTMGNDMNVGSAPMSNVVNIGLG